MGVGVRGSRPQGWPQETEQLDMDSHAVNHQPGILKGRCMPTLPHMEICVSRDVQGQAGHGMELVQSDGGGAAHLQPTGADTRKLGMDTN